MQPTTIYGICKVTGEMLGNYYHHKYGVDTRSVRFPGIISNVTLPGGGTTDYAVEIYYEAIRSGRFTCPVPSDVYMDMIYMPDALRACVELMEADVVDALKHGSKVHDSLFWQPAEPVEGMLTDPAPAAYYVRVAGIAPAVVEAIYGYGRVVDERYEGCANFVERADEKALAEAARKVEAVGGSVKLVLKRLPEEN